MGVPLPIDFSFNFQLVTNSRFVVALAPVVVVVVVFWSTI